MTEPWIKYGSFKFGLVDMYETFGLRITDCDYDYLSPAPRERKQTIPLRSGAYRFEEKYHEERQILLSIRAENPVRTFWRELSYVLDRTANLYIYDEPEKYYTGRIYDPSQIKRLRNVGVDFELVFTCKPYAIGRSTTDVFTNNVYYPDYHGTANAPTVITIKNTGQTAISGIRIILQNKRG